MRAPTTEEILAAAPEEIPSSTIPMVNKGGRPKKHGTTKHKWHSEEDRIRVASVYAMTGNALRTSEITGINHATIRQWKTQPWWPQIIDRVRREHDDELDAKISKVIDKTLKEVEDRLDGGDYHYDIKTGEMVRVPMKGKEVAVVTSIMMDKRDNIRRKEATQQDEMSIKDTLKRIAESFAQLAKASGAKQPVTIDEETAEIIDVRPAGN
jgi:hypothetical protein